MTEGTGADSISEPARRVKYVSFADASGYGLAAIGYLCGLRAAGFDLSWTPLFAGLNGYAREASTEDALRRLNDPALPADTSTLRSAIRDGDPCDVCVLHAVPELWSAHRQPRGRHVGYTVWETSASPPHWPQLLASVDHLLTPSTFSARVLAESGVRVPIDVVPHTYNPPGHAADGTRFRELHDIPLDHTVFYTIGSWTARKAIWRTLHAYCAAFTARDATTFIVKTSARGPAHENDSRRHPVQQLVQDIVGNYPDAPHVCLIVRELPYDEVHDLHAAGDCYVSLAYGEGWGLGAFDAAGAFRPVIMTGWGGQLDYLSSGDALLVDYKLVPVQDRLGSSSYRPDQRWALADLDDAIDRLRWVYDHHEEAKARGQRLGARVRQDFAPDRVIPRFAAAIV